MRAGPLSDDKVISLLNRYYVPVFVSNEDYEKDGPAPPEERKEKQRIYREAIDRKLPNGTVHAYVVRPDGRIQETLGVVNATREHGRLLIEMLERCAKDLGVAPGDPLVKPATVSVAPQTPDGSLVLHLVSRGENTGPQGGSWREFPAENWLILSQKQWQALLPTRSAEGKAPVAGTSWDVDPHVAASILHYFYPQVEDPADAPRTTIDRQSMKATVTAASPTSATARIEGSLTMRRPFYPGRPVTEKDVVEAAFLGFVTWDPAGGTITSLELVTDRATYAKGKFGVAVSGGGKTDRR